jgi:hypothetical protein
VIAGIITVIAVAVAWLSALVVADDKASRRRWRR